MNTCAQANMRASRIISSVCSRQNIATASRAPQTTSKTASAMLPSEMRPMALCCPPVNGKCRKKRIEKKRPTISTTPSKIRSISADASVTENGIVGPARLQETADQFAGAQGQHFISEQAHENGARRGPNGSGSDGLENQTPTPALHHVGQRHR